MPYAPRAMPERRRSDRRSNPAVPEPLERKRERRGGDRRDSERKKASFVVVSGDTRHEVSGELGLGGASFALSGQLSSHDVTVELRVGRQTLRLDAEVCSAKSARPVHVKFGELDTPTELALAKWLDGGA